MIKIDYPKGESKKNNYEEKYLELFKNKKNEYDKNLATLESTHLLKKYSFRDIILGDIKKLCEFYEKFDNLSEYERTDIINNFSNVFEYQQKQVRTFFENINHEINLNACYYCNMDSVHVYSELDGFKNHLDLLKKATLKQLKTIYNIGDVSANVIVKYKQAERNKWTEETLPEEVIPIYQKILLNKHNKENHFTIDHFIPQDECRILASSLYNLVPSCYVCNSKLKGKLLLVDKKDISNLYKYSPTYEEHEKDGKIIFSMEIDKSINIFDFKKANKKQELLKSIHLDIKSTNGNKTVEVFKLKQRYTIHKEKAVRLAYLNELYSDSSLKEISSIIKKDIAYIKEDIFHAPERSNESLYKLHKDIIKQLNLKS